jgi:hypothetical protein
MENKNVTSLEDLRRYADGVVLELPSFAENQPFIARVSRPSFLKLMSEGKIPNTLIVRANELFSGVATADTEDQGMMKQIYEIMLIFANASLIEPTVEQIEDAGLDLTDEQLMFLFNYAQKGVKALESFREKQSGNQFN